jgi:DNA modification methylase
MRAYNSDITVETFIARHAKPYDPAADNYFREPFAQDTRVGKNSAIYNAHSFHTKVPPEGIVPYILHYTAPGDLIFDPFCGSGMTGVAALMTGRLPHCL